MSPASNDVDTLEAWITWLSLKAIELDSELKQSSDTAA